MRQKSSRIAGAMALSCLILGGFIYFLDQGSYMNLSQQMDKNPSHPPSAMKTTEVKRINDVTLLSKPALKKLIRNTEFLNSSKDTFFIDTPTKSYTVKTQLDIGLQKKMNQTLDRLRSLDRGKPQHVAMVAMDPNTGFIRAMAGFDLDDPNANPCISSEYPAASLFKIVTASAAVDALGYSALTPMYFNGNKYTLYKRQLKETRNKYTSRVSLGKAFAESINPVFGKIGKLYLGRDKLNTYAHAFGFNQNPETDIEFESGRFSVTQSDYHLAELGCGFNRQTMISPIFAAMMVSTILNQGKALVPRMVDQVNASDGTSNATSNGSLIYKSQKEIYKTPITPKTAAIMIQIMKKTITSGTAKKAFRGFSRDKTLSNLTIGGKTGSLSNSKRTVKYDWFTGFGQEKKGKQALVVAVVVGHRKYIGTRASSHGKLILKTYFKPKGKGTK